MGLEAEVNLIGVAVLLVPENSPLEVVTVREKLLSRRTNKVPGMRSLPKESFNYIGEPPEIALGRVMEEEVVLEVPYGRRMPKNLTAHEICRVKPVDWGYVSVYRIIMPAGTRILPGSFIHEVDDPRLDQLHYVIHSPLRTFRGGDREAGLSALRFLDGSCKMPDVYEMVVDKIPEEEFDRVEAIQSKVPSPHPVVTLL